MRLGDIVVVESFSRLGRSTKDLIDLVNYFEENNVKLISVKENFDTTTPQGRLMMTVFQAFSQFERDLIVERTKEGLKSARARGRIGGRPRVGTKDITKAINLYNTEEYSVKEIAEMTGISLTLVGLILFLSSSLSKFHYNYIFLINPIVVLTLVDEYSLGHTLKYTDS